MSDNIQVVVRCRGRNRQEIAAKSPAVVELPNDEFSSQEPYVTIATDPLSTITGISKDVTPSEKVYKVDQVYGVNAEQSLIFDNVALPLFHDFISGLNVTILAYGQTGSGKTYSMFGDGMGDNAGIIPRVLSRLFTSIHTDYMVKISCVELYNEELHDLINSEFNLAAGKTKLRVGVSKESQSSVIHNLTEVHIDSSEMGFNILKACLGKRRTSTTKLNDISSRSHAIFSISLWKKKDGIIGGEQYCVSKMNLVDLAGSENVNKSGAINERAREAGLINKSLLALGKVISALSEGKDIRHIPYRESVLTRILEGSIGGRTKTALIATISPAKVNISETISTLNYASKAKNIKNLPQSTSDIELISKRVLVRDLSGQIARLERDRMASKDKDGFVRISHQNYQEFCQARTEHETVVKEKAASIKKLTEKLQLKTAEEASCQQKIALLEEQLTDASQTIKNKDSLISEMRDESTKKQTLISKREESFARELHNLQSKTAELMSKAISLVHSDSTIVAEDLETQKSKIVNCLQTAQSSFSDELGILQKQFSPGWMQEMASLLQQGLDMAEDLKPLQKLDVGPELSELKTLETMVSRGVENALAMPSHEPLIQASTKQMEQNQSNVKMELLNQFKKILDSTFTAYSSQASLAVRDNATRLLLNCNKETSAALEVLSHGQAKVAQTLAKKTTNQVQAVMELQRKLETKTNGAGAKMCQNFEHKMSQGIQSLTKLNKEQANVSIHLVKTCLDETKAMVRKSGDEFSTRIEAGKQNMLSPLKEISENIPSTGSPKVGLHHALRRSPQKFGLPQPKRRKPQSPTKTNNFQFSSQIPQLSSLRKFG